MIYPRVSNAVTEIVSPIKPIEGAAMKKVIIMSSVGGMDEILDHNSCLIFKSDDINSLVEKIKISLNQKKREELSMNAKLWVENNRTWNKLALNFKGIISS